MFLSVKFTTEPLSRVNYISFEESGRKFYFVASKGSTEHFYTNIPVNVFPKIIWNTPHKLTILSENDKPYMTELQKELNTSLISYKNLNYKREVVGIPTKAIISFPHFRGHAGFEAPYAVLDSHKLGIDNCLHLCFQDPFLTGGGYYLTDSFGDSPVPTAVEIINLELASFGLTSANVTFLGLSKGGCIANLISSHFSNNQLIVAALQTDIAHFLKNTPYQHVGEAFDYLEVKIPDMAEILFEQARFKDVHWFYAENDDTSNCGYENYSGSKLNLYANTVGHSDVYPHNSDRIATLIRDFHGVDI